MAINPNDQYTLSGSQLEDLRDYVQAATELPASVVGSTAPTTSTAANVGQLYLNTTTDKVYICTAKTAQGTTPETYTYTWEEVGAGGGSGGVSDVQVNGASVVSGGVANIGYANSSTPGVLKISSTTGTGISSAGVIYSSNSSYSTYLSASDYFFISKGTLENVIDGKGLPTLTLSTTDIGEGASLPANTLYGVYE